MSILSTNTRLIKVGQDYSAGSGISIEDKVISVTGGLGNTYSAGENISIYNQGEQLYISSKDWTNDIANASANAYNEAVAQIPAPFDPSFISGQVDNKLDTTAFTAWQNGQYSTDLQTIEGQISNKLDESAFRQVSSTFLTAINIPESAVWQDVSTTVQTNSAQWAEGGSGDDEVNALVHSNSGNWNTVTNKLDTSSFSTISGNFLTAAPANMATTGDVAELAQTISEQYQVKGDYLIRSDSANFYPSNNPSGFITGVDLSNYYTKNETSGKEELANAFANIPVGDVEVNSFVHNNSATINEVNTTYQSNSSNYITAHQSLDGYATTSWVTEQGYITGVSMPESATWNEVSTTVQTNSAQWSEGGGGAISSYTTEWCHDVPPYGDNVINRLNDKYLKAFISDSADRANFANNANNANSANYAETVNETYVENKGFTRNLSSEYGTISVIHNNIIESTNSAIVRTGNEGFVSSFEGASIGPEVNGTVTYSWDKSLPNTTINLDMSWSNNEILTYSANTNLTGEIVLPTGVNTQTINIPNATEFKVWSNIWIGLNGAVVSAADQFETVVGELAWASALPTYEYDNTNKISSINGSALAGGSDIPSGTMNVSGLEYNAVNEISAYNGSAIAQYGAEKQWLQHDDTLVHAANSAQYALGVNLSAVAQLLGVDETVLYNDFTGRPTTVGSYIDLSESPLNFTEIAIYLNGSNPAGNNNKANGYERVPTEQLSSTNTLEFLKEFVGIVGDTGTVHDMGCGYSGTSGTRWTKWYGYSYNVQQKNVNFKNNKHLNIWKVIGIGRKQ